MTAITDILDQLNRELVALHDTHRHAAEEAYPGRRGEIAGMTLGEYNERMATCDHEQAIAIGIDLARELVLSARETAAQEATH